MKIKLLKQVFIAGNSYLPGTEMQVINEIARQLIHEGKAFQKEFVTSAEDIALKKKREQNDLELVNILSLPFKELKKQIPQIKNMDVLKELYNDKRRSIREAALKQFELLKP